MMLKTNVIRTFLLAMDCNIYSNTSTKKSMLQVRSACIEIFRLRFFDESGSAFDLSQPKGTVCPLWFKTDLPL